MPLTDWLRNKTIISITNNLWLAVSSQTNQNSFASSDFRMAIIRFTVRLYSASMMNIICEHSIIRKGSGESHFQFPWHIKAEGILNQMNEGTEINV